MRIFCSQQRLLAPILGLLFISFTVTATSRDLCHVLLTGRQTQDPEVNFWSDRDYAVSYKETGATGILRSRYDQELKTRIYYSATGKVDPVTGAALIRDGDAKALFVFVHGSGTAKSSGRNFQAQFNQLAELGYSSLSFDLPFHMDGPIAENFYDADHFMGWLNQILQKYRHNDVPLFLVGHSFGPDVIAEYLRRYPHSATGAALLSPAGFNPILDHWQTRMTERMSFGGDVPENTLGGEWAARVAEQFRWNSGRPENDPSQLNPNLQIRVLSGDREEYVPAPIGGKTRTPIGRNTYNFEAAMRRILRNAIITVEPNVGHYLFEHKDAHGSNIVLRELLALVNEHPRNLPALIKAHKDRPVTEVERLESLLADDPLFRAWLKALRKLRPTLSIIRDRREYAAKGLLSEYQTAKLQREKQIYDGMLSTREWAPSFYADVLDGSKNQSLNVLLLKYADEIELLTLEDQIRFGLIREVTE